MKVVSLGFGVPFGVVLLWMFGNYWGLGWWLFLSVVALATGRVWAFFMWFVFKNVYAIDEPKDANSEPMDRTWIVVFLCGCRVLTRAEIGRDLILSKGMRPNLVFLGDYFPCAIEPIESDIAAGASGQLRITAIVNEAGLKHFKVDSEFQLCEGIKPLAFGKVSEMEKSYLSSNADQ